MKQIPLPTAYSILLIISCYSITTVNGGKLSKAKRFVVSSSLIMEDSSAGLTPKFQLSNLTLTLPNGTTLLHELSLTIPAEKITGVIGPSGSGKSTLLRCLNRLWEPPVNSIFLDGQDITSLNVLTLRRQVGMLFQKPALFAGTVAENVAYGPNLQNETLTDEQISALLKMAGLPADMAGRQAIELSGGEAQRVALARTLANQPQVLLLDEPTSALDPAATRQVEETILRLRDELGLTIIWVSHAVEQVARTANWVVLLSAGRVIETGTPAHLLESEHHHLVKDFAEGKL